MAGKVQSVERADQLVRRLLEKENATVSELAEELELPLSTAYDYISTLQSIGYVVERSDGRYELSFDFLEIGNRIRNQYDVYRVSKPELKKLSDETGEYATLMVEENNLAVVLSMKKGNKSSNINIKRTHPGTKTRLSTTAAGKAILAQFSEERVQSVIDQYGLAPKTENTITSRQELFDELETIEKRGYAIDDQERFEGMRGIGAAVDTNTEDVTAAIALYGPAHRLTDPVLFEELPDSILEVKNVIEINISYS